MYISLQINCGYTQVWIWLKDFCWSSFKYSCMKKAVNTHFNVLISLWQHGCSWYCIIDFKYNTLQDRSFPYSRVCMHASTQIKYGCLSSTPSLSYKGRGATWNYGGANVTSYTLSTCSYIHPTNSTFDLLNSEFPSV